MNKQFALALIAFGVLLGLGGCSEGDEATITIDAPTTDNSQTDSGNTTTNNSGGGDGGGDGGGQGMGGGPDSRAVGAGRSRTALCSVRRGGAGRGGGTHTGDHTG